MFPTMAISAECDQVFLHITSQVAPIGKVMYLEALHAPAGLASPVISFEDLLPQF